MYYFLKFLIEWKKCLLIAPENENKWIYQNGTGNTFIIWKRVNSTPHF